MTPEQLAYWMQGFAELHPEPPSPAQWQSIREHVASVFDKETPPLRPERNGIEHMEAIRRILKEPFEEGRLHIYPRRHPGRARLLC